MVLDWVTRIWTLSHYRMVLFIRNDKQDKLFTIGALIYGLWVGGMACFAFALYYENTGIWWIPAFGGLLFVISDFIIGVTDIGGRKLKYEPLWIWFTYVAAQMCIVYGNIDTLQIVDRLFGEYPFVTMLRCFCCKAERLYSSAAL